MRESEQREQQSGRQADERESAERDDRAGLSDQEAGEGGRHHGHAEVGGRSRGKPPQFRPLVLDEIEGDEGNEKTMGRIFPRRPQGHKSFSVEA